MAKTGISLPFAADKNGRLVLSSGEVQLSKVILLNLSDCDSRNPFQDLGLGNDFIFGMNDEAIQAELRRRINLLFRRLQLKERARLLQPPVFTVLSETQELDCTIVYLNMEENKEEDVTVRFSTQTHPGASLVDALTRG